MPTVGTEQERPAPGGRLSVSEISILVVGKTDRPEFRDARGALDELGHVAAAADVPSAVEALAGGELAPDVIVLAQAYPGQFAAEAIDRLRRLAPLARVLALLGSWCEGEMRSGEPWPAAIRVYWHQWSPRAAQEIARLRDGACSSWALPITAGEEERLLQLADQPLRQREGRLAICTPQFEMHDWLASACARRGYTTVWLRPHRPEAVEGATAAVFDAHECRGEELRSLEQLAVALSPIPIVALLDFPRVEDRRRALAAGAAAVLSKPLWIEDLFWQIDRLVDREPEVRVE
jgi:CheY-like chemotaxis protein